MRGVRQGDPVSPYLFNISMDFLIRWIEKLTELNFLSYPFRHCRSCLLYADDTLLFLRPTRNQILKAGLLFRIFGQLSGLNVNLSKSEISITSTSLFLTQSLAAEIQCKATTFSIQYLGLPLSDKRITKAEYMPLIDKIQKKLTGWKASLLSVGGRLIMVNSVITAMPQFFMAVFMLPKWVIHRIDKIRRTFLWHGHKDNQGRNRGLYMANWTLVTRPKSLGGLGVRNIDLANKALLAKWMWQWHDASSTWWKEATPMVSESHKPWKDPNGSVFWKSIANIRPPFDCSIRYTVGNGEAVTFWEDNWLGTPLKFLFPSLYQAMNDQHHLSVSQYFDGTHWLLQLPMLDHHLQLQGAQLLAQLQHVQVTQSPDEVRWLRNANSFTVSSFYKFLSLTPSPIPVIKNIWSIKAPLRVLVFAWLLMNNRLTTIDNLQRRGWCLPNMCIMCKQNEESVAHLFQHCTLAKEIRGYIQSVFSGHFEISTRFTTAYSLHMLTDTAEKTDGRNWEITTCFVLWRERCRRIFSEKFSSPLLLVREIRTEIAAWFKCDGPPVIDAN